MRRPVVKLVATLGLFGLAVGSWWLGECLAPSIGVWQVAGNAFVAHLIVFLLLLQGQSLIENVVVIAMISTVGLVALFGTGDRISAGVGLVIWNVLGGAWYFPIFAGSLAVLLGGGGGRAGDAGQPPSA